MTVEGIHGSLPWFVSGTLEPEEAEAFERHLVDCEACRKEMAFLDKLRAELEHHGQDFLAEHPSAERIAAVLDPASAEDGVSEDEATEVRRHLALCATCAEESRWLRGEETAGRSTAPAAETARRPSGRTAYRQWAAAAAVVAVAVLLGIWVRQIPSEGDSGIARHHLVHETRRTGAAVTEVRVRPHDDRIYLMFEVDLGSDDFPATFEIDGSRDRTMLRREVTRADLHDDAYLFVDLRRHEFPDGSYTARLTGAHRTGEPAVEYPFRVVGGSPGP